MFEFRDQEDYLKFDVSVENDSELQSYLDCSVTISFSTNGFSGSASSYILKEDMVTFCESLKLLDLKRNGEVKLNDVSGDIEFIIKSIDSLGHIGILCKVQRNGYLRDNTETYMSAGFLEIDPSQLERFIKEPWLSRYNCLTNWST